MDSAKEGTILTPSTIVEELKKAWDLIPNKIEKLNYHEVKLPLFKERRLPRKLKKRLVKRKYFLKYLKKHYKNRGLKPLPANVAERLWVQHQWLPFSPTCLEKGRIPHFGLDEKTFGSVVKDAIMNGRRLVDIIPNLTINKKKPND